MTESGVGRVGIRELRANVAALVRRAASGERVVVTSDGVPVAVLGPLSPDGGAGVTMDDLVAAGLVVPPGRTDRPEPPEPATLPIDTRSSRVLDELRGA